MRSARAQGDQAKSQRLARRRVQRALQSRGGPARALQSYGGRARGGTGFHRETPAALRGSLDRTSMSSNFIQDITDEARASGRFGGRVHPRFPPEPNGYLHIGHAKSICLNFGLAQANAGLCNLRFDDTNPTTEELEYVQAIERDVRWLGFDWEDRLFYASDYFEKMYDYAVQLIRK